MVRNKGGGQSDGKALILLHSLCVDFWVRYMTSPPHSRHHYELILDASPCCLYLDIEYKLGEYTIENVELLLVILQERLLQALNTTYALSPLLTRSDVLDLDSSSSIKFSRHWVVRGEKCQVAFRDNLHGEAGTRMWYMSLIC